ncbi:MAG: YggS family pyridoxal phosphate-dependent enzyme [Pirellulaceae bacterium]|nr:YggS family pyridoxal phosphate-dependent enzyme [Pirellulaceae bacterium]
MSDSKNDPNLTRLRENLQKTGQTIAEAATRSGRDSTAVTLVAVTKYLTTSQTALLPEAGTLALGESRPQQLWKKGAEIVAPNLQWHLIGHLQRNKIKPTLPLVSLIHSVDSLRLLEELNRQAALQKRTVPYLLEVNISADSNKHGFRSKEIETVLDKVDDYPWLSLRGFMAMASREGGRTRAEADFKKTKQLFDDLKKKHPQGANLTELSMGMSSDYDLAIEQGATIVRVGSALYEGVF